MLLVLPASVVQLERLVLPDPRARLVHLGNQATREQLVRLATQDRKVWVVTPEQQEVVDLLVRLDTLVPLV